MLGHMLLRVLASTDGIEVLGALRSSKLLDGLAHSESQLVTGIDIADCTAVESVLANWRPDVVVNCVAARPSVEALADMAAFVESNAVWPHRLAAATAHLGSRLVHISSDGVFSGKRGFYNEEDEPDPPDIYCMAKLLGEPAGSHVVTLRTSIIGPELANGTGLLAWFLSQKGPVHGFGRWMFSGFTTLELSRIIAQYVLRDPSLSGLFHIASSSISKLAILRLLADAYEHHIEIIDDDEVILDRTLDGSRFATRTGYVAPAWLPMIAAMRDFET